MFSGVTVWFLLALMLLLLEGCFSGLFFFLSISFGCFVATGVCFLSQNLLIQFFSAATGSVIGLFLLKRFLSLEKLSTAELKSYQSNTFALIGMTGIAITFLKEGQNGLVKLEGEVWHAKNIGPDIFAGESVVVVKIEGNRVFVKKTGCLEQKS